MKRAELEAALSYQQRWPIFQIRVKLDGEGNVLRGEVRVARIMIEVVDAVEDRRWGAAGRLENEIQRWLDLESPVEAAEWRKKWDERLGGMPKLRWALEHSQDRVFQRARLSELEKQIVRLRLASQSWRAIGAELRKPESSCRLWYGNAIRAIRDWALGGLDSGESERPGDLGSSQLESDGERVSSNGRSHR